MKIYQIISEDYDQLARLGSVGGDSSTGTTPSTSDTGSAVGKAVDTAKQVANTATGYLPSWFNVDFNSLAVAIGAGLTGSTTTVGANKLTTFTAGTGTVTFS